jgi:hypothetical protein
MTEEDLLELFLKTQKYKTPLYWWYKGKSENSFIFGFKTNNFLKDVLFTKYLNKGGYKIEIIVQDNKNGNEYIFDIFSKNAVLWREANRIYDYMHANFLLLKNQFKIVNNKTCFYKPKRKNKKIQNPQHSLIL